jgi:acyl dehydratase
MSWFDDFEIGDVERSGEHVALHDEMVAYAARNDPYPIHIDDEAAAATPLGGIIASFGYTVSLVVRAGDRLHVVNTVTDKRLASRGDRGVLSCHLDVINQNDDVVLTIEATSIVLCRPTETPPTPTPA